MLVRVEELSHSPEVLWREPVQTRVPLLNVGRPRRDGALAPTVRVNVPSYKFANFPVKLDNDGWARRPAVTDG